MSRTDDADALFERAAACLRGEGVPRDLASARDPVRNSDGMGFTWPLENPAVHALNRRIAAASDTGPEQGEPLQVLRYRPGEQYRTHYDAIPGFANQREWTMIIWLNADYRGGETHFPQIGLLEIIFCQYIQRQEQKEHRRGIDFDIHAIEPNTKCKSNDCQTDDG